MASSDVTVPQQQPHPPGPEGDQGDVTVSGCLKGGSTKTTTANYLAFVRAQLRKRRVGKNLPVKVLDADTTSQTTYDWFKEARKEGLEYPLSVERYPFEDLGEYLAELRNEGHDVFVDIGGGNVSLFHKAVKECDRLVVPVSPSDFDTRRLKPTFEETEQVADSHARGSFETYVLLARCNQNTRQPRDARAKLLKLQYAGAPLPVLETEVSQLVEYERALGKVPKNLDEYATAWDEMMRAEADKRAAAGTVAG